LIRIARLGQARRGADFVVVVVETHGRVHAEFTKLLKRLAIQLDGYHGVREMAVKGMRHMPPECAAEPGGLEQTTAQSELNPVISLNLFCLVESFLIKFC
jgi:hypothetical protein